MVAEALACGIPVLISNQVNIWREIQNENSGFVEQDTLSGTINLFEAWRRLGEAERSVMKANCHLCFDRHFNLERNAGRLLELIESIGQRNPSRVE